MLNFTKKSVGPIGLDIGHSLIKMVQLSCGGGQDRVVAAQKARIDKGFVETADQMEFLAATIKQMLSGGNFVGKEVISSISNDELHITSVRLGQMDEEEISKAAHKEASIRFGLGSDDVVDYISVGEVPQGEEIKNEIVLFAAESKVINDHIQLLSQAGLEPVAVDPVPCALSRSFDRTLRREEDKNQTMVFVDVGSSYTTVVFRKDNEITFIKEIPVGTSTFDKQISDRLDITEAEAEVIRGNLRAERRTDLSSFDNATTVQSTAVKSGLDVSTRQAVIDAIGVVAQKLAKEISLCLRYYTVTFRGKRVGRAIFTGGGAYENTLLNVLGRQLAIDIEIAEPFKGFDISGLKMSNKLSSSMCEWSVAVGLALKTMEA